MTDDILNRMRSFFSGDEGVSDDKKILLEMIRDDLSKNKFSEFYHPGSGKETLTVLDTVNGGRTLIPVAQWNSLLAGLLDLDRSNILVLMVRHIRRNPVWDPKTPESRREEGHSRFEKLQADTRGIINNIQTNLEKEEIERLAREVFGSTEPRRLRLYGSPRWQLEPQFSILESCILPERLT